MYYELGEKALERARERNWILTVYDSRSGEALRAIPYSKSFLAKRAAKLAMQWLPPDKFHTSIDPPRLYEGVDNG